MEDAVTELTNRLLMKVDPTTELADKPQLLVFEVDWLAYLPAAEVVTLGDFTEGCVAWS